MMKWFVGVFVWVMVVQGAVAQTFGVIESFASVDDAAELGVSWTRVMLHWGELQPNSPDEWVQTKEGQVTDALIDSEIAAGRDVVAIVIGIPDWARDERLLPQGLALAHDDPSNTFGVFMKQAAERYNGRITHWIVWNEPDIWQKGTTGHTWDGDERDFAALMRVAWHVLKEENSENVIHLAALTWFWDANYGREQYLDRLLTILINDSDAVANHLYFDVATAHLYFNPTNVRNVMGGWNEIMAKHGVERPWWLVETNAPQTDDPDWPVADVTLAVSEADQANYMGQGIGAAMSMGAERIAIYKLRDTKQDKEANPEPFGLVRSDGERRDGFVAYQTAIQVLDGAVAAEQERWDEIGKVRVELPESQVHILFARHGGAQTAVVPALSDSATLISALGEEQTILPIDDRFRIDLPGTPCTQPMGDSCMIGGTTHYLVQELPVEAIMSDRSWIIALIGGAIVGLIIEIILWKVIKR